MGLVPARLKEGALEPAAWAEGEEAGAWWTQDGLQCGGSSRDRSVACQGCRGRGFPQKSVGGRGPAAIE
jgi:hypothetical protein